MLYPIELRVLEEPYSIFLCLPRKWLRAGSQEIRTVTLVTGADRVSDCGAVVNRVCRKFTQGVSEKRTLCHSTSFINKPR